MVHSEEGYYKSLLINSPVATVLLDTNGRITTCNPAFEQLFGYSSYEAIGRSVDDLVTDETVITEAAGYTDRIAAGGETIRATGRRKTRTGAYVDVEMRGVPIRDGSAITGVLALYNDATDLLRAERNLKNAHKSISNILDGLDADVYVADMETYRILFMNQHMRQSFGDDLTGGICHKVFRNEDSPCRHCSNARLINSAGEPTGVIVWEGQNPLTGKWYKNSDRAIPWDDGRYVRLQIATDITSLKEAEARLEYTATHDSLTDLPNRSVLQDRLRHAINLAKRTGNLVAVLFLDLDGFKAVNDTFGHEWGDKVLCHVGKEISGALRKYDTLARISGDEFALVLEQLPDCQTALSVAERVAQLVSMPEEIAGQDVELSASIGVAFFPDDGSDADELLRLADDAMYSVKRSGKNAVARGLRSGEDPAKGDKRITH